MLHRVSGKLDRRILVRTPRVLERAIIPVTDITTF